MDAERQEAERQRRLQALADRAARSAKLLAKTSSALNAHNQQLAQVHQKVTDLQTNVVRADQTIRSLSSASPSPATTRPLISAATVVIPPSTVLPPRTPHHHPPITTSVPTSIPAPFVIPDTRFLKQPDISDSSNLN
jgi:hypothetical protein